MDRNIIRSSNYFYLGINKKVFRDTEDSSWRLVHLH